MDNIERKILEILNLPVTIKPINHWEGTQYKPYHKKMVDLEKVIEILEFKMDENLHTNKELLDKFTDLTNRKAHQELFLFDLLDGDFELLVKLEEKLHKNYLSYCPGDLKECEKVLAMDCKYDGLKEFESFKDL